MTPLEKQDWIDEKRKEWSEWVMTLCMFDGSKWEDIADEFEPWIFPALQDSYDKGTQEALAKVEQIVIEDVPWQYQERLLHHLQQLKDNKTV